MRLSEGMELEDIIAGIHDAIASRVARMVNKFNIGADVILTGGVAKNIGVVKAMEDRLGCQIMVPEEPLLSGALGAALLAKEIVFKALAQGKNVLRAERLIGEAKFFS